jgi:hypothetical protein
VGGKGEWLTGDEWENQTYGDDIVICEKPTEDVSRYGSYAEEVQDEEHDGVRRLIGMKYENAPGKACLERPTWRNTPAKPLNASTVSVSGRGRATVPYLLPCLPEWSSRRLRPTLDAVVQHSEREEVDWE